MASALGKAATDGDETSLDALEEELIKTLRISPGERPKAPPTGAWTAPMNRPDPAHPCSAKVAPSESRETRHATDTGREFPAEGASEPCKSAPEARQPCADRREPQEAGPSPGQPAPRDCPELSIASTYERLNADLAHAIIERVHAFSPAFFERLIVDLLLRMGYGGGRQEMGKALGKVGDGGVDGVIREDELGLDVVYVQAKRLRPDNAVPVREVRDFIGGLEAHRATKGVFVTTSYFPTSAYDLVTRVSKRVVLIDGNELANLMIRHRVGVRVKGVYEVKKIDEEYFVE